MGSVDVALLGSNVRVVVSEIKEEGVPFSVNVFVMGRGADSENVKVIDEVTDTLTETVVDALPDTVAETDREPSGVVVEVLDKDCDPEDDTVSDRDVRGLCDIVTSSVGVSLVEEVGD